MQTLAMFGIDPLPMVWRWSSAAMARSPTSRARAVVPSQYAVVVSGVRNSAYVTGPPLRETASASILHMLRWRLCTPCWCLKDGGKMV